MIDKSKEKNGWWVAYFAVMVFLFAGSIFFGPHSPIRFLILVFNGFGLVGLWGYLSDKPIGWRHIWVIYASLMFIGAAASFGPGLWHGIRHDLALFFVLIVAACFTFPQWLAVWRYAFRSPHIWQAAPAAA